jgi:hypothetical protein
MIELFVAVCMIDQPTHCKEIPLTFEGDGVSTQQCFMSGQMALAQWAGEHPNWVIKKWSCAIAGQVAKI